jgi:hypothetical protein
MSDNIANTLDEAVPLINALPLERFSKRSIYNDLRYGYTFSIANEDALLNSRKRKFPTYTYYLPDGQSFHVAGELLDTMVKNARTRLRAVRARNDISEALERKREVIDAGNKLSNATVGDPVPGRLARYGFVDFLDGGVGAMRGDRGGGPVAKAPERSERPAPQQSDRSSDDTHHKSAAAVEAAGGDVQDPAEGGVQIQHQPTNVDDLEERRKRRRRRRRS